MFIAQKLYPQNKKNMLGAIQRVRMKIGAIHLSDIVTVDGGEIDSNFNYYSRTAHPIRRNNKHWPVHHHLTHMDMIHWRNFLKAISTGTNSILPCPLGKWLKMTEEAWVEEWDYFVSDDKQFIYHRYGDKQWRRHLKNPNSHRSYYIPYLAMETIPCCTLLRTSITKTVTVILVTSTAKQPSDMPTLPPTPTVHTFHYIKLMTPKVDWFMNHLSTSHRTDRLWSNLLSGIAYAVSDGSYFRNSETGACASIIATPDGSQ